MHYPGHGGCAVLAVGSARSDPAAVFPECGAGRQAAAAGPGAAAGGGGGLGVPVPAAMPLGSRAACDAAIAGGLPVMVKSGQSIGGKGVALCRTPAEVIGAFERFAVRGTSVTVQRFYTGPTYLAGGLFVRAGTDAETLPDPARPGRLAHPADQNPIITSVEDSGEQRPLADVRARGPRRGKCGHYDGRPMARQAWGGVRLPGGMSVSAGSVGRVLESFHPAVRAWFEGRFPAGPTEPQAAGWREIAAGRHTLIAAPTGSGKTLAAFLVCIDRFYRAHDSRLRPRSFLRARGRPAAGRPGRTNPGRRRAAGGVRVAAEGAGDRHPAEPRGAAARDRRGWPASSGSAHR